MQNPLNSPLRGQAIGLLILAALILLIIPAVTDLSLIHI